MEKISTISLAIASLLKEAGVLRSIGNMAVKHPTIATGIAGAALGAAGGAVGDGAEGAARGAVLGGALSAGTAALVGPKFMRQKIAPIFSKATKTKSVAEAATYAGA